MNVAAGTGGWVDKGRQMGHAVGELDIMLGYVGGCCCVRRCIFCRARVRETFYGSPYFFSGLKGLGTRHS